MSASSMTASPARATCEPRGRPKGPSLQQEVRAGRCGPRIYRDIYILLVGRHCRHLLGLVCVERRVGSRGFRSALLARGSCCLVGRLVLPCLVSVGPQRWQAYSRLEQRLPSRPRACLGSRASVG